MITTLMLLASVSPFNTFNDLYLYKNNAVPVSYQLVSPLKLQGDQYLLRVLESHNGPVCAKEIVTISDLNDIVPFYYGQRVYVNQGFSTKSGSVVGLKGESSLIHYEGKPCSDYAREVPTLNIIPIN